MIRINGVPLDNPAMGWVFRPKSVPYSGFEANLTQVSVAGRDGHIPTSTTLRAPIWPLQVNTAPGGWEALQALFRSPALVMSRDDMPGYETAIRFVSSTPDRVFTGNEFIDATFYVEITGAYWRSKDIKTFSAALSAASVALSCWPGLSAPVQDAVLRVKGPATGIQVTDASGAWVRIPDAATGQWVRYDSGTGKCWRTTTDTWSGGTDVSGLVDYGGPRGQFEVTPAIVASDPASRIGSLTVATVTRGGTFEVRGKSAHSI